MAEKIKMLEKHKGFMKFFDKLFGSLYRLGIIKSLEGRMMSITTTGRHSGKKIQTLVNYLKKEDKIYAFSTYKVSDWLKNIQKNPDVDIQIGKTKFKAKAQLVEDPGEKGEAFQAFIDKIGKKGGGKYYYVKRGMDTDDIRSIGEQLPTIRFTTEK